MANKVAEPLKASPGWLTDKTVGVAPANKQVNLPELKPRKGAPRGRVSARFAQFAAEGVDQVVEFMLSVRGREPSRSADEPVPTCAVLSRKRSELMPTLNALREAGIPAQLASGEALLQHPAVSDLRAALEITADIGRGSSLSRLLANLDLGALDLRVLANLAHSLASRAAPADGGRPQALMLDAVAHVGSGAQVEGLSESGRLRVTKLAEKLDLLRAGSDQDLVGQVESARHILRLDAAALADPSAAGVSEALDQFTALAAEYATTVPRASLEAFLGWLEVAEEQERGIQIPSVSLDPSAVQVMTVHGAKGLEWDAVAVVGMAQGSFPSSDSRGFKAPADPLPPVAKEEPDPASGWWGDLGELPYPIRIDRAHLPQPDVWDMSQTGRALENFFKEEIGSYREREERRLAYVALTRAKSDMLLSGAWNSSPKQVRLPSAFLTEAAEQPGVNAQLADSPTAQQIADRGLSGGAPRFPREPGPRRKANEQVAARVMETLADIERTQGDRKGRRQQVLATLSDRELAESAAVLLAQRDRALSRPKLADMSPEQVLSFVGAQRGLSVTDIAAFQADPQVKAAELLRPVPQKPGGTAALGTAFHHWVEQHLRRVSASSDEPEDFAASQQLGQALSEQERVDLEQMRSRFLEADPAKGFEIVGLEVPFSVPAAGFPVRGRVDAVLRDKDGNYRLIDWKTRSRIPRFLDAGTVIYYQTQLEHYLEAWKAKAEEEGVSLTAELQFVTPEGLLQVPVERLSDLAEKR